MPPAPRPPPASSRAFLVLGTIGLSEGRPILELADAADPSCRLTLRPGLPPTQVPHHPGLSPVLLTGRLEGELVWGEGRGDALPLDRLGSDLPDEALCLVLLDLCEVLRTLHAGGVAHGDFRAPNVLVGADGWVAVAGAGVWKGSIEEDMGALVRLRRELFHEDAPESAEVAPFEVAVVEADLRHRLGAEDVLELRRGLSMVVRARMPALQTESLPVIHVVVQSRPGMVGRFDEVGMDLGPDVESTSGEVFATSGEVTREALLDDPTEEASSSQDPESSRVQILARLLAPPAGPLFPDRFAASEGLVCEPMRKRISEERPDPLFVFDDSSVLALSEPGDAPVGNQPAGPSKPNFPGR
jgi:hypothetical protein